MGNFQMENDQFICKHCEKIIRYERPLFCPYCGQKVDPTQGLEEKSDESKIYPWSSVAPILMKYFLAWIGVSVFVLIFFGRRLFFWISMAFATFALVVLLLSVFSHKNQEDRKIT